MLTDNVVESVHPFAPESYLVSKGSRGVGREFLEEPNAVIGMSEHGLKFGEGRRR